MSDEHKPLSRISAEHLDIFKEIGNIGAGNATTALAVMLNKRIDMGVTQACLVPFNEITDILGGPENLVVGLMVGMSGDMNGYMLMVLDVKDAYHMIYMLTGDKVDSIRVEDISELDLSTIEEIANILVSAYLSAISSLTGLQIGQTVPEIALDMAGAIMSVPAIEYGKVGEEVLLMETEFYDGSSGAVSTIAGHFFLVPDIQSYYVLLRSLGIETQ